MIQELSQNNINTLIVLDYARLKELYLMIREDVRKELEEKSSKSRAADVLVTRAEAQELLGKSETTLWRWRRNGILIPIKVGQNDMYRMGDIDKILKGGRRV